MGKPLRLLIIEDSEDDAEFVLRELRQDGFDPAWERVDTAEGMQSALARQDWDIIISDHSMPVFSAPAALALLHRTGRDIPFIIVSGSIGEEQAVQAMKLGAKDYILKGRLTKLPAAVTREVREAELRREHSQSKELLSQTQGRLDVAMGQLMQAEKMTALGELVAGVAHEINNPLSTIMGYTQLLLARGVPAEIQRRLDIVHSEANRLAKIVRNLLTFARKHPPEKKHLGLNGIIEKTLELKAYHFRASQIIVEKDLAADLPGTMLDFHQIQQVVLNLLNNAEQAIVEVKRGGTIRLTTRQAGDRIECRIADDGPGVPREIAERIFEPFFTTKKEGKGTGLGLSLCYGIIQEHGGSIRVECGPGQGATFVIDLPLLGNPETALPDTADTVPATVSSLRILVIDDESSIQDLLVELLRTQGHQVDTASDVPEALQKIASNGHDLIISDMKMPHGTGRDIYRAVLQKNARMARRIVFTTGDGASAEIKKFLTEAGNEILFKPFKLEDLAKAIALATRN
ncbi:MAG TPA: response regulator [Candidatus Polarisedimenticolia bacterium]|jgi:signal transduction histidine kinase|nr:response regulator [Candidatus Polarisedimenticolia bacterium]